MQVIHRIERSGNIRMRSACPGSCPLRLGRGRWWPALLPGCLVIALLATLVPRANAHPILADYVHHDISLTIGPAEINLDIELTFQQFCAMSQRRRMDTDHDGRLTQRDLEVYLADIEESIEDGVRLDIGGHPVDLVLLYDPRIELQRGPQIDLTPCTMRLSFFGRTPLSLGTQSEVVVEDSLWPTLPALCRLDAAGRDGIRVLSLSREEVFESPVNGAQMRKLRARCAAAPLPPRKTQTSLDAAPTPADVAQLPLPAITPLGTSAHSSEKPGILILCAAITAAGITVIRRYFRGQTP